MKRSILWFIIALLLPAAQAVAQGRNGEISFSDPVFERSGDAMEISVTADLSDLNARRQQAVVLTPVLIENRAGGDTYEFTPVTIAGRARFKAIDRQTRLNPSKDRITIVRHTGRSGAAHEFRLSAPYQAWMDNATLTMIEEISGCAQCSIARNEYKLEREVAVPVLVLMQEFVPNFRLSLVVPPQDTVKRRAETYSAWLKFDVGRSVLRRDLGSNGQILNEVDRTIERLLADRNVGSITISVRGYASPEGSQTLNMSLSNDRARAFVNHITANHGFSRDMINYRGYGEDWAGLRAAVEKSNLADRQALLNIIDGTRNIKERKARIAKLSGGRAYSYMLRNIYPSLRRIEYTISYTIKPFDVEGTREILNTTPEMLSLYEMYKLASSYEKESYEFREVFYTAVRVLPTDPIANINASALDIVIEADDVAISRIYTLNTPEAWNNLAIAYFKKGFYANAEEFFTKAANAGEANGIYNLEQFRLWKAAAEGTVER